MSSLINDKALDARIQAMVEVRVQTMMMSGAAHLPAAINDGTLLDAKQVRGPVLGNRSDMWLWRRQNDPDPEKKFPDPDMVIAGRRYWYFGTIRTWLANQAASGKTRRPAATASGADVRKIETVTAPVEPTLPIAPTHKAPSPIAAMPAKAI
jgi:hypothetical protein